jgi:hypothetical protein
VEESEYGGIHGSFCAHGEGFHYTRIREHETLKGEMV